MCGLYGDIYDDDGTTIFRTYYEEIRRMSGNPRPELLTDNDIDAARSSSSERVERLTHLEDVDHTEETELYNLMSEATNYFASSYCMVPFNDKQEARRVNSEEATKICTAIREGTAETDITQDISDPIVGSEYSSSSLATDGIGEGSFYITKYARGY